MKLQYFGTAAAEGIPSVFCGCPVCVEARKMKGKYLRTRSQAMIDDTLLIDFNADAYIHSLTYDVDLSKLEHLFITHVHEDHYYPTEFLNRREGYSHAMQTPTLTVHGSEDLPLYARRGWKSLGVDENILEKQKRIAFDFMRPYERKEINGYFVTALPAAHGTPHPYIYVFEKDGKALLYFNDSGYLSEETMAFLRECKIKFDLVSYDCTWGKDDAGVSAQVHMGVPNNIVARQRFIDNGNYKDSTISVITHFSHNIKGVGYGDMVKVAQENGFLLAYDGMTVEF